MSDFVPVAKVSDFSEGKIRRYFIDKHEIGVVLWQGTWHAFDNHCTHAGFQLHFGYVEDDCLNCPIHYGVWDLGTGKAKYGPVSDLPTYEVRVVDDDVQVQRPTGPTAAELTGITRR